MIAFGKGELAMKKIIGTLAVAALVQAVLAGCMGTMVKKDRIAETGRLLQAVR